MYARRGHAMLPELHYPVCLSKRSGVGTVFGIARFGRPDLILCAQREIA